jgi:hypothetical protein
MKGSIGTPTTLVYIKDKRKVFKSKHYLVCQKCKQSIKKGSWIKPSINRTYRHAKCPATPTA